MAEQITITVRPTGMRYGTGLGSKCWDGDASTYNADSNGYGSRLRTLALNLSQIPGNSVIKSVTYYITAYRTDNASYCGLAAALGYSTGTAVGAQQRVTPLQSIDLTDYQKKQTRSATQSVTAAQSQQILSANTPILWLEVYGAHRYYEIWADITYEPDESKLYNGSKQASAIYVGTKQGEMYVGTTKVL